MTHPTDLDLVDYVEGVLDPAATAKIREHIDRCPQCRSVLTEVASPPATSPLTMKLAPPVAAGSAAFHRAFTQPPGVPSAGELWQLQWGSDAEAVVIMNIAGADVEVVPTAFDPAEGDERALILPAEENPLGVDGAVWVGLHTTVTMAVLNVGFGSIAPIAFERIRSARYALDSGLPVGQEHMPFGPIQSSGDPRALERVGLAGRLRRLSAVRWPDEASADPPVALRARAVELGLSVAQVAARLGVPAGEVTELFRGRRAPTHDEATALAEMLRIDPERINPRPSIPADLVLVLQLPSWRPRLRQRAASRGYSELEARNDVAQEVLPMAARTTGVMRGHPDWNQLVADALSDDA